MAGPHRNVPDKPPSVPLKPTSKLGPLGKKRVLETPASASALKRPRPTLAGGDGGPGVFLNPFPEPFDPGMSVSESEELTRRLHQRMDQDSSEAMSEIEQATEDINAAIDPSLRDMEPTSALTEQRLSHERVPTLDSGPIQNAAYMHPQGRGSASASRAPASAPSRPVSTSIRGPTPDAVTASRTRLVTPSTTGSAFEPTSRRLGAPPLKPSATSSQFRTPDIPPVRRAGFSTSTEPSQRAAATSLSSSRVTSAAFTDKIANLDTIVAQLSEKVDRLTLQSRESAEIKPRIEELTQENNMLRATVEDHRAAIHELEATVDAQSASLEELLTLINGLRSAGATPPTVKSVDKATKAVRDNVFNNAIRHTFFHAMGISDSKQATSLGVLDDGSFWFKCPTRDANLLRPNFAGSWSENADWRDDMVRYIRLKACEVFAQLPVDHLSQKTDTDIIKQLKEVFENTRGSIKKGSKGQDALEARNRKQRQTARKNRKNIERSAIEIRKETGTDGPEWDWFFQVGYQSTDESDGGGTHNGKRVVDFASDSETAQVPPIKKSSKSKNADTVNEKVSLINDAVNKRRADRKNFIVPIVVGEKCDKDLPKPANNKLKIRREFIDPAWLAENSQMDVPSRVDADAPTRPCDPDAGRGLGDEYVSGNDTLYDGGDEEDLEE
ncbi:hypothetical protein DEU56DRAFT_923703 [Suillus clintonianus]|uniref:uncharacterized protein n=1 Tax=Suillus clintonianus TaxID=1904413 RepID=UPI001B8868E2|nr:uncharacterized protein DEU56DRAFT_923703 [Suillus clintonianus]KAG2123994.1 hypothetical protein DEU56DRAFT_923703 [Suillus clintonianus]